MPDFYDLAEGGLRDLGENFTEGFEQLGENFTKGFAGGPGGVLQRGLTGGLFGTTGAAGDAEPTKENV